MKYIAFHNGRMLDETILENIIYAAKRGKMTPAGEKLLLVPDKKPSRVGPDGCRLVAHVKKSECIPLSRAFGHLKAA